MLACDFLTSRNRLSAALLATRRIEYVACTSNPDGGWVDQQARNLIMQCGDEQPFRFLVHDRDTRSSTTPSTLTHAPSPGRRLRVVDTASRVARFPSDPQAQPCQGRGVRGVLVLSSTGRRT